MKPSPFRIIKYITRGRVQDGHPAEPHEEYRTAIEPVEKYKNFILQKQRKSTKLSLYRTRERVQDYHLKELEEEYKAVTLQKQMKKQICQPYRTRERG